MAFLRVLALTLLSTCVAEDTVTLLTFANGDPGYPFEVVNDPVMGGVSSSTYNITGDRMIWKGTVRDVPSLQAPGFCKVMTHGVHQGFPDVSAFTHLTVDVKCYEPAYSGYKIDFSTVKHPNFSFGSYKADFPSNFNSTACVNTAAGYGGDEWTRVAIPFTSFTNDWSGYTGEPIHTCAEDPQYCPTLTDLATITQLSFWAEGAAGNFKIDLQTIGAANL
mmetsp:Transcript_39257/g.79289  ORF Transcript_39257/g.79289 Transcript_39257/m.79289 type:complete len:220 (+) Transcript_39257:28-687(+)